MSRLEAGAVVLHKEPHTLESAVSAALEECHGVARDRFSIHIPADLPAVPMDFVLIEQVLVNLIDNAAKYSPERSPIEIDARQENGEVAVSVRDSGIGIPPEQLPRVFDRFMRAAGARSTAGMGLGLSICKGFVEAHGGRIQAQTRPGGGTIVTFTLPAESALDSQ